jgi:hypothetical protein
MPGMLYNKYPGPVSGICGIRSCYKKKNPQLILSYSKPQNDMDRVAKFFKRPLSTQKWICGEPQVRPVLQTYELNPKFYNVEFTNWIESMRVQNIFFKERNLLNAF